MYNGVIGGFYKVSEWIMKLAYVNILWIFFTLTGLVMFGFFPATTAMFTVIRKWQQGNTDIPTFRTFWQAFKKELLKSNVLGLILCMIGFILYTDYVFLKDSASGLVELTYFPLLLIFLIFLLTVLYIFPVFVHYEIKVLQVIKNAFLIMIMCPLITIMMVVGIVLFYYLIRMLPGLIPFFGGSVLAYITLWSCKLAFDKMERLKQG